MQPEKFDQNYEFQEKIIVESPGKSSSKKSVTSDDMTPDLSIEDYKDVDASAHGDAKDTLLE